MTNNAAERALRCIAVGRNNWTFAGSDAGGRRAAAIYTLIETAKLNDVDPQAWLADVFTPAGPLGQTHRRVAALELETATPERPRRLNPSFRAPPFNRSLRGLHRTRTIQTLISPTCSPKSSRAIPSAASTSYCPSPTSSPKPCTWLRPENIAYSIPRAFPIAPVPSSKSPSAIGPVGRNVACATMPSTSISMSTTPPRRTAAKFPDTRHLALVQRPDPRLGLHEHRPPQAASGPRRLFCHPRTSR
jgi:hypothetical protein